MGTKGRDLLLLFMMILLVATMVTSIAGLRIEMLFWLAVIVSMGLLWHYLYEVPQARKQSVAMGLEVVILLPLNYYWARLLVSRLKPKKMPAYEIHIQNAPNTLYDFTNVLDNELALVKSKLSGLFLWETTAPVPSSFRQLIRGHAQAGRAFWEKGGWPIPRMPFVGRELKKGQVRKGAIIFVKGE